MSARWIEWWIIASVCALLFVVFLVVMFIVPGAFTPPQRASSPTAQAVAAVASPASVATPIPVVTAAAVPVVSPFPSATAVRASESIEDVVARASKSVVLIVAGDSSCTGAQIKEGILSAAHCFRNADRADILTTGHVTTKAKVIRIDAQRDLALLQADADLSLPPLEIGLARDQRIGETVLALGYPRIDAVSRIGSDLGTPTLTRGLLSAVREERGTGVVRIQTDVALNPGNSGGPLLDEQGKLIGVASFGIADSTGLNFGVAGETITDFLASPVPAPAAP